MVIDDPQSGDEVRTPSTNTSHGAEERAQSTAGIAFPVGNFVDTPCHEEIRAASRPSYASSGLSSSESLSTDMSMSFPHPESNFLLQEDWYATYLDTPQLMDMGGQTYGNDPDCGGFHPDLNYSHQSKHETAVYHQNPFPPPTWTQNSHAQGHSIDMGGPSYGNNPNLVGSLHSPLDYARPLKYEIAMDHPHTFPPPEWTHNGYAQGQPRYGHA